MRLEAKIRKKLTKGYLRMNLIPEQEQVETLVILHSGNDKMWISIKEFPMVSNE